MSSNQHSAEKCVDLPVRLTDSGDNFIIFGVCVNIHTLARVIHMDERKFMAIDVFFPLLLLREIYYLKWIKKIGTT